MTGIGRASGKVFNDGTSGQHGPSRPHCDGEASSSPASGRRHTWPIEANSTLWTRHVRSSAFLTSVCMISGVRSRPGVSRDVRDRILNHGRSRKGSITDVVDNHYEYEAVKRAALEPWSDTIDAILSRCPSEIDGYHPRLSRLKGIDQIRLAGQIHADPCARSS
jgi:hypothetical protein